MRTSLWSGIRILVLTAGASVVLSAGASAADIVPEWLARLQVGASLSAGHGGMVVDQAGNTYVTATGGSSSNTDIVTAAYAADGALLWSRTFDGAAGWHDQARGLVLGPGGVLYVTGNTPDPLSYAQVLVLAYDTTTGALLRVIQPVSGPSNSEHGGSVAVDGAGHIVVAGGTTGDGGDALVMAFTPTGDIAWRRTWDGPAWAPYSQDTALKVLVDPVGDPVVMMHGVMGSNQPDYVVVKYAAATGATLWQATWGVNGGDYPRDMAIDSHGDVYVTGTGIDMIDKYSTVKFRGSDGSLVWQAYDSAAVDNAAAGVALDGAGGVYVTGSVDPDGDHSNLNDDIYTVKRAADTGSLLWTHRYGASCLWCYDVPADVIADPSGHVFVGGTTSSPPYTSDAILLVLDGATGAETHRGIVSGGAVETSGWRELRLDGSSNLRAAGHIQNANTGFLDVSVAKYAAIGPPTLPCRFWNRAAACAIAPVAEVGSTGKR